MLTTAPMDEGEDSGRVKTEYIEVSEDPADAVDGFSNRGHPWEYENYTPRQIDPL